MKNHKRIFYTHPKLTDTQYLAKTAERNEIGEIKCRGFEDGKRKATLDGWYKIEQLKIKKCSTKK